MKKLNQIAAELLNRKQKWESLPKFIFSINKNSLTAEEKYKVKELKIAVEQIAALREKRAAAAATTTTVRQQIYAAYQPLLNSIAKALPSDGYSMGGSRTVYIKKAVNAPVGRYSDAQDYARSYKYSATHGSVSLHLSLRELRNTRVIGGLITIILGKINKGLAQVEWVDSTGSKGSHRLTRVAGYLSGGHHFTAASVTEAKKKAKEIITAERIRVQKEKKYAAALKIKDTRIFVSKEDSISGGNCLAGTENFAKILRINLNVIGAVRADVILAAAAKNNVVHYAVRAITAAKLRYAGL